MTDPTPKEAATGRVVVADPSGQLGRFAGLNANYWKLWTASAVSNLGDGIGQVAYPWLAAVLTRDPLLIAGVGLAQRLPWLAFSLHAGAIVDRGDRRRLMVSMNSIRFVATVIVAAAVLTDVMTIPLLYVAALVLGCAEVVYDNSAQTILPRLVAKERLERANGNIWGAEMVANSFVGPPLGGFLIAVSLALPFGVDALTFGVSALLIFLIGGMFRSQPSGEPQPHTRRPMRAEIAEGFRWLWRHPLLRTLAIVLGVMNMMGTAALATFVLFVQEVLALDAAGFGILSTAGAIGGVLGSQLAPSVTKRIGPGPSLYLCLVVGGAVTTAVTGVTSNAFLVGAMFVVYSFTAVVWNVITVSLRQTIIPDHLLGRVNSVYRFFGWGMMPLGALLGGALVAVAEPGFGREIALRLPFFASSAVHVILFLLVGAHLSTPNIEAAKGEAERTTA